MLVVFRFAIDGDATGFVGEAHEAMAALAERPGYLRGELARAYDDPAEWCLLTEWSSVGAYRRALGSYEVKTRATPLLARATPAASAFEVLATAAPGGPVTPVTSDRAESTQIPSRP